LIIFLVLLFTFGLPSVVAFLIYSYGEIQKPLEFAKMGKCEAFARAKKPTREREVVVREILMVRCQYCGG
jgi:hypothetical protein